jgi:hypothetical protein
VPISTPARFWRLDSTPKAVPALFKRVGIERSPGAVKIASVMIEGGVWAPTGSITDR